MKLIADYLRKPQLLTFSELNHLVGIVRSKVRRFALPTQTVHEIYRAAGARYSIKGVRKVAQD